MRFFRSMTLGFPLPPVQRQGEVRGRTKAIGGCESVAVFWYGRDPKSGVSPQQKSYKIMENIWKSNKRSNDFEH